MSGQDGSNGVGIGTTTVAGTMFTVGTTTSALVVANNGYVGIGTATPQAKLDIAAGTSASYATRDASIIFHRTDLPTSYANRITNSFAGVTSNTTMNFELTSANGVGYTNILTLEGDSKVGIATSSPRYALDVWGSMSVGTSTGTNVPALYILSGNGGQVGIGTTTLSTNLLTVGTTTPNLVVANNGYVGIGTTDPTYKLSVAGDIEIDSGGTALRFYSGGSTATYITESWGIELRGNTSQPVQILGTALQVGYDQTSSVTRNAGDALISGNVGIGTTTPYSKLTINESNDFAFGDFNASTVDTMEGALLHWLSSNATLVTTSTESTIVKAGGQSLKISASGDCEDIVVQQSYASAQNFSASMERLGFWIYASQIATSSATTTQMISVGLYSSANGASGTSTRPIYIQEEGKWQYEDWTISGLQNATSVDSVFFRLDVGQISATNFYIDQIRLYNATERSGEMFVDKSGALTIMGRGAVAIGRADGSSNKPGLRIDSAIVEVNQPFAVNVGGDVGMNNDLQFLSTGLSQITSEGPLRIVAGDLNHSENLTLTTGGAGDVIVELNASSSSFMVNHAWAASTTVPFIINSESNATNTAEMDSKGILFQIISDYSTDENTVFSIDASGNFYYDRGAYTPAADVAENYFVSDETIQAGDVVCLAASSITVEKCSRQYQNNLIGVISTQPALLMAADIMAARPVALAGRVPVKVSLDAGTIAIGDALTSASSTPGAAMKATASGKILGYALEPFDGTATSSDKIYALISLQDKSSGDLSVFQNSDGNLEVRTLTQNGLATLFKIGSDGALVVDKIKTNQLCVGSVCVTENEFMKVFGAGVILGSSTSTESVCTNGANRPCSSEVGACRIGVEVCSNGQWGSCIGAVFPTAEICDGVDNNCDGVIDEGDVCAPIVSATSTATTTP